MRAWAVALAALVVLAAGCGRGEKAGDVTPVGRAVSAKTSLAPTTHLFAEPVVARLDVVVNGDEIDPDHIRVKAAFEPYEIVGPVRRKRESFGSVTRLRYEYTIRCLLIACIPQVLQGAAEAQETGRGERITFRFKPAQVLEEEPGAEPQLMRNAAWPTLQSVSRINASDVPRFGFVFKTNVTPLPDATFRASPALLGGGLLAGSLALLAFPAVVVGRGLRRRRPQPVEEEPELPPLERALLLVEWAGSRENGSERRGALEMLAVELDSAERRDLADAARALAWSPVFPAPEASGKLVASVREADAQPA